MSNRGGFVRKIVAVLLFLAMAVAVIGPVQLLISAANSAESTETVAQ